MDPAVGDLPQGDVLIEGDRIVEVGPQISADAEVIDADGFIVIPGFIDTHRHTWEAGDPRLRAERHAGRLLRRGPGHVRAGLPAEDVYASNLAGALEWLNAGIYHAGRLVAHQQHPSIRRADQGCAA
jgi:cytosine/adenosine deaminase-related metal-dependent hydrolase